MPPALVSRSRTRFTWAGWWVVPLLCLGALVVSLFAFVGPVGLLVSLALLTPFLLRRQNRWEIDQPGAGATFRFGARAKSSVTVADVDLIVVQHAPEASHKGIPLSRPYELWYLISNRRSTLGSASSWGLDPVDVERARSLLGAPQISLSEAKRHADVWGALPWHVRRRGLNFVVWLGALALLVALLLLAFHEPFSWSSVIRGLTLAGWLDD